MLKIKKLLTSPYRQSTNNVERMHSWLGNYLRTIVDKNPANRDEFLALAAHAYNNTVHNGTKQVPMEALFGFVSDIPVALKRNPSPLYNADHYPNVYRHRSQVVQQAAREALMDSKRVSKGYADRTANVVVFHVGDKVLALEPPRSPKLAPKYSGPHVIVNKHGAVNVSIMRQGKKRPEIIHVDRLKPFHE